MLSESTYKEKLPNESGVLHPTYHDVQIKHVHVIHPSSGTVKFKDHESKSFNFEEENLQENESFCAGANKLDENLCKDVNTSPATGAEATPNISVHLMSVPLATNQLDYELQPNCATPNLRKQTITHNLFEERRRKHKEELMLRKQQVIQTLNQFARRPSIKNRPEHPQFYEVAPGVVIPERPISGAKQSSDFHNTYEQQLYQTRLNTVPRSGRRRVWTGVKSASSRAISTMSSSRWKLDEQSPPKLNMFIKMPFKQVPALTMNTEYKAEDDLISPGEELRVATAFTVSRVRHAIRRMAEPARLDSRQGRLLKGRLKPLRPVPDWMFLSCNQPEQNPISRSCPIDCGIVTNSQEHAFPNIRACRGIQPDGRTESYSPSPSRLRHLKEQYLEVCKMHESTPLEEEYERRMKVQSTTPVESLHCTSPRLEAEVNLEHEQYPVNQNTDVALSRIEERDEIDLPQSDICDYDRFSRQVPAKHPLEEHFDAMHLESSVIY